MERDAAAAATLAAQRDAVPLVRTEVLKAVDTPREIELPGSTQAFDPAVLYARATGYISRRNVDIGSHVHVGDVLAVISAPDLDQQLAEARAQLVQSQIIRNRCGLSCGCKVFRRCGASRRIPTTQSERATRQQSNQCLTAFGLGYFASRPEHNRPFNDAMTAQTHVHVAGILDAYDFSAFQPLPMSAAEMAICFDRCWRQTQERAVCCSIRPM